MIVGSIPIFSANLVTFEKKFNSLRIFLDILDTHNSIKHVMIYQHIFSFSTLHIFYIKMATSEGGGGVCISCITQIGVVVTLFWLIWHQTEFLMVKYTPVLLSLYSL